MSLAEKLELLVTMDASQAVSSVQNFSKQADASIRQTESSLKRISSAGLKLGGAGIGVGGLLTQMASGDIEAANQLEAAIGQVGQSYTDFKDRIGEAADAQAKFGHTDEEVNNALSTLVLSFGDTGAALNQMQLVADLAAKKHISLGDAASIVAKAHGGAGRVFKEFNVAVQTNADGTKDYDGALTQLAGKLQGQASAGADSFGGKLRELHAIVENGVSEFGQNYGPAILGVSVAITALSSVASGVGSVLNYVRGAHYAAAVAAQTQAAADLELAAAATAMGSAEHLAAIESLGAGAGASTAGAGALAAAAPFAILAGAVAAIGYGLTIAGDGFATFNPKIGDGVEVIKEFNTASKEQFDLIQIIATAAGKSQYDVGKAYAEQSIPAAEAYADRLDREGESSTDVRRAIDDVVASKREHASAEQDARDKIDGTNTALAAQKKALDDLEKTNHTAVDSARSLFDAQSSYAQAERGVESALRSQQDATERVTDAQKALNEALNPKNKAEDVGKAGLDIESARLRVADSAQTVTDEERKLEELRAKGGTGEMVASQERRVAEARIAAKQAVFGVTDAEQRLADVKKKGTEADDAVITARKQLDDAVQGQLDAASQVEQAYATEAGAAAKVKDEQYKMTGGTLTANQAMRDQLAAFKDLESQLDPNSAYRKNVHDYITDLERLYNIFGGEPYKPEDLGQTGQRQGQGRAMGGSGYAGQSYFIEPGARGEYFTPSGTGWFTPAAQAGQTGPQITQHIYGGNAEEQQAQAARRLRIEAMLAAA